MMPWRWAAVVSLCLGCLMGAGAASAVELSDTLPADTSDLFSKFRYKAYQLDLDEPGLLRARLRSNEFDAYLMLVSPKGDVFINDDEPQAAAERVAGASRRNDAGVTVQKALAGRWLLVATTSSFNSGGAYQLVLDGAARVEALKTPSEEALAKVRRAFFERGVEDVEGRRQALLEQLTLPSFRASLRRRIGSEMRRLEDPKREQQLRKDLATTQSDLAQLAAAMKEVGGLQSAAVVRDLLRREIESKTERETRYRDELLKLVTDRSGYSAALEKLSSLEEVSQALQRQEKALADPGEPKATAGAELPRLRQEEEALRRAIADKLLESRIVSELDHRLAGIRLLAGLEERRMESGLLGALAGSLNFMSNNRRQGMAYLGAVAGVSTGSVDATSTLGSEAPPDPGVWLPALLPWPPPASSSQWVIHRRDLKSRGRRLDTLGHLDDLLRAGLTDVGYPSPRYWGGVPRGFAVVTPLEQIASDGAPLSPDWRWREAVAEMTSFSLSQYLKALVTAPAGYFRVLVFIVSSRPFATRDDAEKLDIIQRWASAGLNALPASVRDEPYTDEHLTTLLIYEFEKHGRHQPVATKPGRLSALDHLRATKLATTFGVTAARF